MLLVAAVIVGVVVLTPLADRIRVPQPILLLVYGLVLALIPALPMLQVDAHLVLPLVLPPLLFAATQRTTVGEFREAAAPVLLLAVGLTVTTAAVAAVVAHLVGLPWAAAAVLGAIVSPPDPVAATAVARRLKLPERIVTVLEGEGMFNDATALVMYNVAVAAAVTGEFSAGATLLELLLAVLVGIGAGIALGWLTKLALGRLHDAAAEMTVTLVMPFAAYLGAEHLRGSGVLAVLALGLFLRTYAHPALTARGWLLGQAVWGYVDFAVTSLVFVLVGFELTSVIEDAHHLGESVRLACWVLLAVVLFRPLWIFPATALARASARRRNRYAPYGWRETAVVSWAGMRGVVTVATALALPATAADGSELTWREPVVLVGLACVLVTLLGQGLTLGPLVQRLGVGSDVDERAEIDRLNCRATAAGLRRVRELVGPSPSPLQQAIVEQLRQQLSLQELFDDLQSGDPAQHSREEADRLVLAAVEAQRELVLAARADGDVTPAAADAVLRQIEGRAVRVGS